MISFGSSIVGEKWWRPQLHLQRSQTYWYYGWTSTSNHYSKPWF